ncbi:MAG TPA: T9SS type A sorting domain-containing protein [Candidatus Kapabacteria bacterium]|nr:T9SS type A sorting domain-containing protein [Candidatus Kapabacteria bacterium]
MATTNGFSQWIKTADHLIGIIPGDCCGFGNITFRSGIAWAGRDGAIWNSLDSGVTWNQVSAGVGAVVTQIDFFDKFTGVMSTRNGIYITHDQGINWSKILAVSDSYGISFAGSTNNIIASADGRGFFYSTNSGSTWSTFNPGDHELGALGLSNGAAVAHSGSDFSTFGNLRETTDFGATWNAIIPGVDYDCFGIAVDSCSNDNIYLMNEEGHIFTDRRCQIFKVNTKTNTLDTILDRPGHFIVGAMSFSPHALYIGTLTDGVNRTTDGGKNWKSIGGPSINNDTRLVCAISDNIILSSDNNGSIWRTTNSGGDPITIVPVGAKLSFKFHSGTIISDSFGVTIQLPIYLKHTGTMGPVDMVIHYPDGPLKYLGSFLFYGKSIDVSGSRWSGRAKLHIDADDLNALTDSLVGFVAFKWFPLEFDCSKVHFDSITSSLQIAADCSGAQASAMDSTQGIIGAYKYCDPLADVMVPSSSKQLFSFAPNPVGASGSIYSSIYDGPLDVSIYDMSGKLVLQLKDQISPVNPMKCNLIDLASGVYHLAIEGRNLLPYDFTFVHTK